MENRVIVVDDEVDFLDSVRRGLITSGYTNVHLASDPMKVAQLLEGDREMNTTLKKEAAEEIKRCRRIPGDRPEPDRQRLPAVPRT